MSERDPWLTEKEAAKELRVSVATVRAERKDGRLGCAPLRGRVFYPMSILMAYKASLICPAKSTFGNTPSAAGGTSLGRRASDRAVFQRARETVERLKGSGRLSS